MRLYEEGADLRYATALFADVDFYNRFQFALFREGTMPINYRQLHNLRQKMDKYRYKDAKYKYYSQMIMGGKNPLQTCDLGCAKKCFRDSLGTAWFIFSSCLIPQCNCALHPLPQSMLFQIAPEDEEVLNDNDALEDETGQTQADQGEADPEANFEAVISLQSQNGEYNLYRDCNLLCHKDCLSIRKNVPFDVLDLCVSERCHCRHNYTLEHPPFYCDVKCRDNCVENSKYYWNGSPTLTECITMCGCYNQMQQFIGWQFPG